MRLLLLFVLAIGAAGHGMMTKPKSRNGGMLNISGCQFAPNDLPHAPNKSQQACIDHVSWFCGSFLSDNRICLSKPGPATIPEHMYSSPPNWPPQKNMAWRAPGTSMPISPCATSLYHGDGRNLPKILPRPVWKQGTVEQVGWSIWANHGGGYAWRLCPEEEEVTEECFRKYPLDFADSKSIIEWVNKTQLTIDALTTDVGTTPQGSQWRRNPIPSTEFCGLAPCTPCPEGFSGPPCPAFKPPCPGCWGAESPGPSVHSRSGHDDFSILDNIIVPKNLKAGNYVLQWRWDNELYTQQIWTNCADIEIVAPVNSILV